jgi:hypothetical protein
MGKKEMKKQKKRENNRRTKRNVRKIKKRHIYSSTERAAENKTHHCTLPSNSVCRSVPILSFVSTWIRCSFSGGGSDLPLAMLTAVL